MDPKLAILILLIGVILGLSHLARGDRPRVKSNVRRSWFGK
jgi:hypothetical protein